MRQFVSLCGREQTNLERKIGGDIEPHDEICQPNKMFLWRLGRLHDESYVAVRRILFAYRHAKIHGGPQQPRAAHLLGLQALVSRYLWLVASQHEHVAVVIDD